MYNLSREILRMTSLNGLKSPIVSQSEKVYRRKSAEAVVGISAKGPDS